jgi:hypothetical protein
VRNSVLSSPRSRSWVRRILRRFRRRGIRPAGGYVKPSASTGTKALGMRTRVMVTTEGFSFSSLRPEVWGLMSAQIVLLPASRCTVPISFGSETGSPGASGEPPERADSGEAT